jgi:hypothetical protein
MAKFAIGTKAPKKEVKKALEQKAPGITDGAFLIRFRSDDGGQYVEIMAERKEGAENDDSAFHGHLNCAKFMGWRTSRLNVPYGYIRVFFNEDGTDKITGSTY